jgi:hypothetical protein
MSSLWNIPIKCESKIILEEIMRIRVSRLLRNMIRLDDRRAYRIAQEANLHPSTLSRIINGIEQIKPDDPRVIAIGKAIGLTPNECFTAELIERNSNV